MSKERFCSSRAAPSTLQVALDLTAETFAQAFSGRASFRGQSDQEAAGWLFAIARRQLARYFADGVARGEVLARLGVEVPVAPSWEVDRIDELAGLDELRGAVKDQLGQLSSGLREALELRVVDEQPYALVAARLGISEHAARMRVSRALKLLVNTLADFSGAITGV
jgi:RNA polymerase sigma-70 factor (ECF subfamily)